MSSIGNKRRIETTRRGVNRNYEKTFIESYKCELCSIASALGQDKWTDEIAQIERRR